MSDSSSNMPRWAKKTDDHGKRYWNKEKPYKNYKGEYVASIIFNLIWLFIVNKVPDWHLKFINDHYPAILWALNMNILIQIGANIIMLVFMTGFIRHLFKIITEAANFLLMILIYYIYPFDFSTTAGWAFLDTLIPWLLIIGMVVSALTVLSHAWRLIFRRD